MPTSKVEPLRAKRRCPECGQPSERAFYPFCSERCKAVDLHRWLSNAYVIPGPAVEETQIPEPESDEDR